MYLTDYREQTLKDVITQLEPGLFKKVTGLTVKDFELLVSLGVFNDALMNDAVYKFRRYEDSSLTYTGIDKHEGERVGLFDTTLSDFEYMAMAQKESMVAPNGLARPTKSAARVSSATRILRTAGKTVTKSSAATPSATDPITKSHESEPSVSGDNHTSATTPAVEAVAPAKPAVTREQLDALSEGDTVFHKAFGYGRIVNLNGSYIDVTFDSDDKKKKPSRKFMFPSVFYQGLLKIG